MRRGRYPVNGFPNLIFLDLSSNALHGSIPVSLYTTNVQRLFLNDNLFDGSLPEMADSAQSSPCSLQHISLSSNYLTGPLPQVLSQCVNLTSFSASEMYLTGSVEGLYAGSKRLQQLGLANNFLSGRLDDAFAASNALGIVLNAAYDAFTGPLPTTSLSSGQWQALILTLNCFSGTLPGDALCTNTKMTEILISGLHAATDCRQKALSVANTWHFYTSYLESNAVVGTSPNCLLRNLPLLEYLTMSSNHLSGTIDDVADLPFGLTGLDLSHNLMTGTSPPHRLTFDFKRLDLSFNRFGGTIPAEVALQYASDDTTKLSLQVNMLSGALPENWVNAYDINVLDGNLFRCAPHSLATTNPPVNDPLAGTYACTATLFARRRDEMDATATRGFLNLLPPQAWLDLFGILGVFNLILAPLVTEVLVSPNCFKYVFSKIPSNSYSVSGGTCFWISYSAMDPVTKVTDYAMAFPCMSHDDLEVTYNTGSPLFGGNFNMIVLSTFGNGEASTIDFQSGFAYNFQCGFSMQQAVVHVFVFRYILSILIVPSLWWALKQLQRYTLRRFGGSFHLVVLVTQMLPRLYRLVDVDDNAPTAAEASAETKPVGGADEEATAKEQTAPSSSHLHDIDTLILVNRPVLKQLQGEHAAMLSAEALLARLMGDAAVALSFGVLFPPLGLLALIGAASDLYTTKHMLDQLRASCRRVGQRIHQSQGDRGIEDYRDYVRTLLSIAGHYEQVYALVYPASSRRRA